MTAGCLEWTLSRLTTGWTWAVVIVWSWNPVLSESGNGCYRPFVLVGGELSRSPARSRIRRPFLASQKFQSRFRSRLHVQLFVNVLHVSFHRGKTDAQP